MSIANLKRYAMRNINLKHMAQQTAVEWLVEQYKKSFTLRINDVMTTIIEQAKKMEKQQIIDAFELGWKDEDRLGSEYYNEKYNK